MKRRDANLILIALAALGGGGVAAVLPLSFIEMALTTSGLSETIPAFAPPLGGTARLSLIGAAMIVCAGLFALFLPWGKGPYSSSGEHKESGMSFIFSKLVFFMRGRKERTPASLEHAGDPLPAEVPVLRRSDSHPDAPARPPLFARRDLGGQALPPEELPAEEIPAAEWEEVPENSSSSPSSDEPAEAETAERLPPAPEPLSWTLIEQEMNRLLGGAKPLVDGEALPAGDAAGASASVTGSPGETGDAAASAIQPTIQQLIERLERGLQRKQAKRPAGGPRPDPVADEGRASAASGLDVLDRLSDEDLQRALAALRPSHSKAE